MNREKELYVLGVGNNTDVIIELIQDIPCYERACPFNKIIGIGHYTKGLSEYRGYKVFETEELLNKDSLEGMDFVLSMGDINIRKELSERIYAKGGNIPTLIHPTAIISESAKIGKGVIINPFCILQANSEVGDDTYLSVRVTLHHDSKIGKNCFISSDASIGARINIGNKVFIGMGSILISDKATPIGDNTIIGAGSVVTKPVLNDKIIKGNPAI